MHQNQQQSSPYSSPIVHQQSPHPNQSTPYQSPAPAPPTSPSPSIIAQEKFVLDEERFDRWYQNAPVRMIFQEGKGRSLVAAKNLAEGETVLKAHPYVWAADENHRSQVCRHCLRENHNSTLSCPLCGQVLYCSNLCQRMDSYLHKGIECKLLQSWELDPNVYEPDVIAEMKLLVRTVARSNFDADFHVPPLVPLATPARNGGYSPSKTNEISTGSPEAANAEWQIEREIRFDDYTTLCAGTDYFPQDMVDGLRFWICNYIADLSQWLKEPTSSHELLDCLMRNRRNSFSVWNEPSMKQRGIAVYVSPSFLNHDCDPNLTLRRHETALLEFIASRAIEEGEELSISYIDNSESVFARRQKLSTNYLFFCQCNKCKEEDRNRVEGFDLDEDYEENGEEEDEV
eukprot:TRINITY_DN123_c0_g1_i1.p1 TRINITY_DN123_c0_g1~~TRINITY_DN123_c0_g1_i1.p1  ORF type:complete len:401 (-),score=74.24 TRINITY_DN123_c0_g1_i1:66-1268(-)